MRRIREVREGLRRKGKKSELTRRRNNERERERWREKERERKSK